MFSKTVCTPNHDKTPILAWISREGVVRPRVFTKFAEVEVKVLMREFGLAIHQNDHQARRRFIGWAQNEIAVVPDFHKRILFSGEAHFWLNGYVNNQNCRIWSEANPQVYVKTPLHSEKLTVWCALWAGGILLQKR
ncbi:putative transposable element [Trichonephila clavipes]|uniref:Putative transposable element n=1 Tax=Trichonephila clavipes TaxID=2585209 RepID=A0A8X6T657_TRICX|nr:putative transposable element [Trichonephila clavipes]